ncbi:MAG: Response regulator, partial [uncultured Phycisphaerae bacterium]
PRQRRRHGRRPHRRRRRLHDQAVQPGRAGRAGRGGRADPVARDARPDDLRDGQARREPRPRDRRAPGARVQLLPRAGDPPRVPAEVPAGGRRRVRPADLPDEPVARHRQGRDPRLRAAEARPPERPRVRDHEGAHDARRAHAGGRPPRAPRGAVPPHGPRHRRHPPRAVGRLGLPEGAEGRRHPAVRADRGAGRRVRRADDQAGVQGRVHARRGPLDHPRGQGHPLRPRHRRRVRRQRGPVPRHPRPLRRRPTRRRGGV